MTHQFLHSLKIQSSPTSNYTSYHISSTFAKTLVPARQGPYIIKPAPKTTAEDKPVDIWSSRSEPAWIVITFAQSKLNIFVELDLIEPRWVKDHLSEDTLSFPYLTTIETVNLKSSCWALQKQDESSQSSSSIENPIVCSPDLFYEDTVYLIHKQGIHALSCPWLATLQHNILSTNIDSDLHLPPSHIRFLLDTTSSAQPKTIINLTDPYLGYKLLVLTNLGRLITIKLSLYSAISDSIIAHHNLPSRSERTLFTPLKTSPFELTLAAHTMSQSQYSVPLSIPKIVLPPLSPILTRLHYPEFVSDASLDLFLSHLAKLRSEYLKPLLLLSKEMADR